MRKSTLSVREGKFSARTLSLRSERVAPGVVDVFVVFQRTQTLRKADGVFACVLVAVVLRFYVHGPRTTANSCGPKDMDVNVPQAN